MSKLDLLPTEEDRATAKQLIEEALGKPTIAISAATGKGLTELLEACWEKLGKSPMGSTQWSKKQESTSDSPVEAVD